MGQQIDPTTVFDEENLDQCKELDPYLLDDTSDRLRLVLMQELMAIGGYSPPAALTQADRIMGNLQYYNIRIS